MRTPTSCSDCSELPMFEAHYYSGRVRWMCEKHAKASILEENPPYKMRKIVRRNTRRAAQLRMGL